MNISFKKTALAAVLGLGLVGIANAASFAPAPACTSYPVTIPCDKNAWDVAFEGFYYQPTNDDLDYITTERASIWNNHIVDPDYDFGFRLEGSFHFKSGNDVTVNWTRFRDTSSDSTDWFIVKEEEKVKGVGEDEKDGEENIAVNTKGKARFEFDSVNIEGGQHFDVGKDLDLRVHVGLQFLNLEHSLSYLTTFTVKKENPGEIPHEFNVRTYSDLKGIGVRGGLDWNYFLGEGFSFVTHMAGALVVSDLEATWEQSAFVDGEEKFDTPKSIYKEERRTVIPTGEAKIGLSYAHDFDEGGMSGTFAVEGGWQVAGYFHSILHVAHNDEDGGMFGQNNDEFEHHTKVSNFGIHGPYLMLKLISSV